MYISIDQVSKLAGVSVSTLRRWDVENYLTCDYRTYGNHRRYNYKKVLQFSGIVKKETKINVVVYARVSSSKQREDLNRQIILLENYARNKDWNIIKIYSDIGSGLNDNRKNLLKMVRDLPTSNINYILCTYKDRFGNLTGRIF